MNRRKRVLLWCLILITGIVLWSIGIAVEARRAWIALLAGLAFFVPLSSGLVTWSAIVVASHGSWPRELERIPLASIGGAVPVLAGLIALWAASPSWEPWSGNGVPHETWFAPAFVFGRNLVALGGFWFLAWRYVSRRARGTARKRAAWLIVAYCVVISLFGFDLIMGLRPRWSSSAFGAYIFITGLYAAAALWSLIAVGLGGPTGPEPGEDRTSRFEKHSRLHDLGKLVFAFSILSSYLLFCQLLPIWYENLPEETLFLVPLINFAPWKWVSIGLLAVVFVGPLVYLLSRKSKRTPWMLATACAVILSGLWVERLWLVLPGFAVTALSIADFGALALFTGFCALGMEFAVPYVPQSLPEKGYRNE